MSTTPPEPPRFPPLADADLDPAQRKLMEHYGGGWQGKLAQQIKGLPRHHDMTLRAPDLAWRLTMVSDYFRSGTALPQRLNELAILLVARDRESMFEWNTHRRWGTDAGLDPALIDALARGERPAGMQDDEAVVYDFVVELQDTRHVSAATFQRTKAALGERQYVDLVAVVGYYTLVAMELAASGQDVPDFRTAVGAAARTAGPGMSAGLANTLRLPMCDGSLQAYTLCGRAAPPAAAGKPFNRVVYSAVHVVTDVLGTTDPWERPSIDWEATLAYRRYLWDLGLGVAEAMDTAQRGMGLGWPEARRLIAHTLAAAKEHPRGAVVCGIATDQLDPAVRHPLSAIADAYVEQLDEVQSRGGRAVLMASRALAASAKGPGDYLAVYDRVLQQAREPVVLHWLGEAFDAQLRSYWGCAKIERAMDTVVELMETHGNRIDGIKLSLLDADWEKAMRRRLPPGAKMYTGDDFNYPELIEGDGEHHSHALLGIFDAIAPLASAALGRLAEGDAAGFRRLLDPTVPLSRHIFRAPTQYYKAGVVFLAWLNGHQDHFQMVGGLQSSRSTVHYAQLFRLADAAGALRDPELALARMRLHLAQAGMPA